MKKFTENQLFEFERNVRLIYAELPDVVQEKNIPIVVNTTIAYCEDDDIQDIGALRYVELFLQCNNIMPIELCSFLDLPRGSSYKQGAAVVIETLLFFYKIETPEQYLNLQRTRQNKALDHFGWR